MTDVGYPDFRRQQDYDSNPIFLSAVNVAGPGVVVKGPYYVGNWAYITGRFFPINLVVTITFEWAEDPAFVTVVGQRLMVFDPGILNYAQFHIPNLGRFVRLTFTPSGGGAWNSITTLFGSNRQRPNELLPITALLCSRNLPALAGGATDTAAFDAYFAGPASVCMNTGGQAGVFFADVQATPGVFSTFGEWVIPANTPLTVSLSIPPSACRFNVRNLGGVPGAFTVIITIDTAGA